jgi:predicted transcriptional regulator
MLTRDCLAANPLRAFSWLRRSCIMAAGDDARLAFVRLSLEPFTPVREGATMALTLNLPPELERRLAEEAAQRGQDVESFAVSVLQQGLTGSGVQHAANQRTPEQIIADSFARFPPGSPEKLTEIARRQGVPVFTSVETLAGDEPPTDKEFDVDAFLAARKEWQREGRALGAGLADVEEGEA